MRKGNEISAKEMAVLHISNRPCPLYPPLASRTGSRPDVSLSRSRTRTNASFTRSSFHQQVVGERFPVDVSINRRCCDSVVVVIVVWLTSFRPRSIRSPLEIGSAKRWWWWWWGANDHPFFSAHAGERKDSLSSSLGFLRRPPSHCLSLLLSVSVSLSLRRLTWSVRAQVTPPMSCAMLLSLCLSLSSSSFLFLMIPSRRLFLVSCRQVVVVYTVRTTKDAFLAIFRTRTDRSQRFYSKTWRWQTYDFNSYNTSGTVITTDNLIETIPTYLLVCRTTILTDSLWNIFYQNSPTYLDELQFDGGKNFFHFQVVDKSCQALLKII